jgi:hypothetical protein
MHMFLAPWREQLPEAPKLTRANVCEMLGFRHKKLFKNGGNLQQMSSTFRFHSNKQTKFTYAAVPPPFFAAASIVACTHAVASPCRADPLQPNVELSIRDVGVNHVGLRNRVAGVMPLSGTTPEVAGKSRPISCKKCWCEQRWFEKSRGGCDATVGHEPA